MASIRTDGTIWQATGKRKESESGGLLKKGRCTYDDGAAAAAVGSNSGQRRVKRRVMLVHTELRAHSNGQTAGHY